MINIEQYNAAISEVEHYSDVDSYVSDMALSRIWGDPEDSAIPGERLDDLRAIYTSVNRSIRDIVTHSGLTQARFGQKYNIPTRTVENWCGGVSSCPLYARLLLQRAEGLLPLTVTP